MKKKIVITFLVGLTFLKFYLYNSDLLSCQHLYAQDPKYPYKRYDNRKEGLVKKKQLVAGERLVLLSAAVENIEPTTSNLPPESYKLGLYLKEPTKLKIKVREFDYFYKMEPLKVDYERGKTIFTWPSEIPLHYDIQIHDLYPLAEIKTPGKQRLVPITLFNDRVQITSPTYAFCFMPSARIRLLEYKIYQAETRELIYNGEMRDLIAEKIFCAKWNGKDNGNNPVTSNVMLLVLQARFARSPGTEIQRVVTFSREFYHFNEYAQVWNR